MLIIQQLLDGTFRIEITLENKAATFNFHGDFQRVKTDAEPDPSGLIIRLKLAGE